MCLTEYECVTDPSCKDAFLIDSTCYKIHKESVPWFTAVNRCLSYNASLAVFSDIVREYFPSSLLSGSAWIGLVKSWWTWPGLGLLKLNDINLNVVVYKTSTYLYPVTLFDVILLHV